MEVPVRHHAVLFPYPALGHIRPMMQLAQYLAHKGFIITFVNTEQNHSLILQTQQRESECAVLSQHEGLDIRLVRLPDGLGAPGQSRTADLGRLARAIDSMEPLLEQLIVDQRDDPVTCIIHDACVFPVKRLADTLGIVRVPFLTFSVAISRILCALDVLVSNGDVSPNGVPTDLSRLIKTFPGVPKLYARELPWLIGGDEDVEFFFHAMQERFSELVGCQWVLCNSSSELEGRMIEMFSKDVKVCPIGPLFGYEFKEAMGRRDNGTSLSLWKEEKECVHWLDRQSPASVIYVSFGSFTMLSQLHLHELALGLEASEQPFLWVVRADLMDGIAPELPEGFTDRTKEQGRVISWAPQLEVLAHPAVGAFMTHCGWNSTMEGVFNGVPIVAWPYFADQYLNARYLVEEWRVGKAMEVGEDGVAKKEDVEEAVRAVMGKNSEMKRRMKQLSESVRACVREGGSSYGKLQEFVAQIQHLASASSSK